MLFMYAQTKNLDIEFDSESGFFILSKFQQK